MAGFRLFRRRLMLPDTLRTSYFMVLALIEELLTGDSKELQDITNNEAILVGFLTLAKGIDALPDITIRFYEDSRSLLPGNLVRNRPR